MFNQFCFFSYRGSNIFFFFIFFTNTVIFNFFRIKLFSCEKMVVCESQLISVRFRLYSRNVVIVFEISKVSLVRRSSVRLYPFTRCAQFDFLFFYNADRVQIIHLVATHRPQRAIFLSCSVRARVCAVLKNCFSIRTSTPTNSEEKSRRLNFIYLLHRRERRQRRRRTRISVLLYVLIFDFRFVMYNTSCKSGRVAS